MDTNIYSFKVYKSNGSPELLSKYRGKVLLIVNTATQCGFRKQFTGMQELYDKYKDRDFMVLAFPSNQFNQEPMPDTEMSAYCKRNYDVSYPIFSKIMVNGETADPLFQYLSDSITGFLGTKVIKWNFTKFLIDSGGKPVERYSPTTIPSKIAEDIEKLL